MQIPYSPLRGSKEPRFMGGSIGPRMEICETSALPIPIAQVGADAILTTACTAFAPKQWLYQKEATGMESSKLFRPSRCRYCTYLCLQTKYPVSGGGSIRPRMERCETSALPIPMVRRLHQSNGYIKRKLRAWRVQNCIALVGADTVLTTACKQSTPFHRG